jgi:hypothetical protein
MNRDYQQDQPWRGDQEQYGTGSQGGQFGPGTPQDQYGTQGGQYGQGTQQGSYGQSAQQGQQGRRGMFSDVRRMAEQQIDQVIDQFGSKIPGASQYTQQAKDAVGGIFDNMEREVENRIGNMGGMSGSSQGN